MYEFLSPEWIDALDSAARSATPPAELPRPLVIEYLLTDGGAADAATGDADGAGGDAADGTGNGGGAGPGSARYHVTITVRAIRVAPGPADHADLTFVTDRATAYALHAGSLAAEDAFAAGLLKVRGDLNVLAGARPVLTSLGDVFAEVRADTTSASAGYDPRPATREAGP